MVEENLEKSKQALIDFKEQEKQIAENHYLLNQLGKVEELTQQTQIIQQPFGVPSSSKTK